MCCKVRGLARDTASSYAVWLTEHMFLAHAYTNTFAGLRLVVFFKHTECVYVNIKHMHTRNLNKCTSTHWICKKNNIQTAIESGTAGKPAVAAAAAAEPVTSGLPAGTPGTDYTDVPHSNVRKVIANRLLQAKTTIPHYYLTVDLAIDDLMALREKVRCMYTRDFLWGCLLLLGWFWCVFESVYARMYPCLFLKFVWVCIPTHVSLSILEICMSLYTHTCILVCC